MTLALGYCVADATCSCGCTAAHVVMHRTTADGVRLALWSDGAITLGRGGRYLRGLGEGRSSWARRARVRAVLGVADDIGLFDAADVPRLVKVAESTYASTWSSEADRRTWVRIRASRRADARAEACR
ncbi:MAG: hypothetical protein M3Q55_09295 [Acidobacteriota bacterium]|nr:hypothetical protein [Acidobacteriota bacterium]